MALGLTPRSGDAPTVGDWETVGRKGQVGQKTVPEPAGMASPRSPRSDDQIALPHTPHGQCSVGRQRFGVNPPGLKESGTSAPFAIPSTRTARIDGIEAL